MSIIALRTPRTTQAPNRSRLAGTEAPTARIYIMHFNSEQRTCCAPSRIENVAESNAGASILSLAKLNA